MNNIAKYFEHIAEVLGSLASDLEMDLSTIHSIEITPGCPNADGKVDEWWIDLNNEQFAEMWRDYSGVCEVVQSHHYSDYEDMYTPQPTNA